MIQVLDKYGNSSTDEGLILVYDKNGNIKKIGGGGGGAVWGSITGTLTAQTDLISYLSSNYTPQARTLTINGTTYDLSANRSWTISASSTSINVVSVNTIAGSASGTDYVYLVSGTTTITLPTAIGNTNLYTVKRVGTNTVTINTTSSQTIDGSLTASLTVQYTSLTIVSDGSNWNII